MESQNNDISKLVLLINQAASTYKEVSNKYADDQLERFFQELCRNHSGFLKKAKRDHITSDRPAVGNLLKDDITLNKESTIDQLIMCIELEKAILDQAREAVHSNCNKNQKALLCQQLTYSENALFKADQMLEVYE